MDLLTFELPKFFAAWLLFMAVAMFSSVAYALVCFYMALSNKMFSTCHLCGKKLKAVDGGKAFKICCQMTEYAAAQNIPEAWRNISLRDFYALDSWRLKGPIRFVARLSLKRNDVARTGKYIDLAGCHDTMVRVLSKEYSLTSDDQYRLHIMYNDQGR